MASAKKIGRMVETDVNKALANIGASTPKPDMKDSGSELKAATAPQKAQTFAEAFRAARAEKGAGKTFTWGGKSYSTNMAGEGAKRSAPSKPAAKAASSTPVRREAPKTGTKVDTRFMKPMASIQPKAQEKAKAAPKVEEKPKRDNTAAGRRERMGKFLSSLNPYNQRDAKGPSSKPLLLTGEAARKANKGTVGGMKKGGSVDGIAVRGKTRAPMKKGK